MMLRWRDMHPYNAVHVVLVPRPFGEIPVAERIGRVLEAHGLTGLVLDRRRRRFEYEGGPAEVTLEILPGGVDPLGVVCREIERQLNQPFPALATRETRSASSRSPASIRSTSASPTTISSPAANQSPCCSMRSRRLAPGRLRSTAAPNLYPGTYRGLFLRHPLVLARRPLQPSAGSSRPRAARFVPATRGRRALTTGSPTFASIRTSRPRSGAQPRPGA
jgi:hypothetical protein